MSKNFKRLAALTLGTAFLPLIGTNLLGGSGCYNNDAFAGLFQSIGDAAIQSVSDGSFFNDDVVDSDYDTLVRIPMTEITQSAWSDYVFGRYAADPEFPNLLSQ